MTELFAFIFGFGLCLALCWKRFRELKRAFLVACKQNDKLRERERRHRETLLKVFAHARELKNILGGRALLPAAAEPIGQRTGHMSIETSGPSFQRRSRFLGRGE